MKKKKNLDVNNSRWNNGRGLRLEHSFLLLASVWILMKNKNYFTIQFILLLFMGPTILFGTIRTQFVTTSNWFIGFERLRPKQ